MKLIRNFVTALGLAAIVAAAAVVPASAQDRDRDYDYNGQGGQCNYSLFGTVVSTRANDRFLLRAVREDFKYIYVNARGAQFNTNGLALRPGVFTGIYGCFAPNHRSFHADEVTMSPNAQDYNGYSRRTVTLDATIIRIEPSMRRMLVRTNVGYLWTYYQPGRYFRGERVRMTGTFNPAQSSFSANSIVKV